MSVHVLLNLLNELRKRDEMRGLPSILLLFRKEFNKFNNTGRCVIIEITQLNCLGNSIQLSPDDLKFPLCPQSSKSNITLAQLLHLKFCNFFLRNPCSMICVCIFIIIIIGFLINVQVQGHHPHQWAPFHVTG